MKICPNCHHEFEDDINFCKDCGTHLVDHLSCPSCGKEVLPNDVFCGSCGARLKEETTKEKKPFKLDTKKIINYATFFVLFAFVLLSFLSFIGLFGDFIYRYDNLNGVSTKTIGLNFFNDMYSDAATAKNNGYNNFANQLNNATTIQLLFYLLAFIGVLFGLVFSIVNAIIFLTKKRLPITKLLFIYPLLAILHPLYLRMVYGGDIVFEGTSYKMISHLGWGAMMIFVSCLIALTLLFIYSYLRLFVTKKEKEEQINIKELVINLVELSLAIIFIFILFISSSHMVNMYYRDSGVTLKGYSGVMSDYLALLLQAEQGSGLPKSAHLMVFGHIVLLFAYMLAIPFIILIISFK